MTREEYLMNCGKFENVTFIIAKAVKDEGTPLHHFEYVTTPIRSAEEWLDSTQKDYIVIKKDHAPIDVTGTWTGWYNNDRLKCAMITKEADLIKMYGEKQGKEMIEIYARNANA